MQTTATAAGDRVLYEFPKSTREVVRARIKRLSGRNYADLRVYYEAETDGPETEYLPSKKGIALRLDLLPELRRTVDALEEAANG
jgi:hypothetical protein